MDLSSQCIIGIGKSIGFRESEYSGAVLCGWGLVSIVCRKKQTREGHGELMMHSVTVSAGGSLDKLRSRGAQLLEHPVVRKERGAPPWGRAEEVLPCK